MLKLSGTLSQTPVVSLRTGRPIAMTDGPIINPNNLKIEGYYCTDILSKQSLILLTQDVREISAPGIIVDDYEVLSEQEDLIRLQKIFEIAYNLHGKQVITVKKQKIGKVQDFAYDTNSFFIQKLYVGQSIIKSFSTGQLIVDRTEIVEVTNRKVVIKELTKKQPHTVAAPAAA